jgi:Tfp pilus assembly protein PilX
VQFLRQLFSMQQIKAEQGIALVMALGLLTVLTISGTAVTYYATTNLTGSNTHKARASAYDLAEAGINDAMAKLYNQLNTDGSLKAGGTKPTVTTLLPSTTIQYSGLKGSVTYSGTLNTTTWLWTITSTGKVKNGLNTQTRVLKRGVTVRGLNVGADGSSWSRFYDNGGGGCMTIDNQAFVTNVATKGNLCLDNGGSITGANVGVDVGGTVTITGPNSASGPRPPSAGTGWTNPTNVYTSNNVYATNAINAVTTGSTQDTTGFGFAIPATAYIIGISVGVERNAGACCNAVQTITLTGSPTGGTFKLNATPPGGGSLVTAAIAYNASAATVQTALVTIFGSGNVTCTGGSLPATAVVCTFAGTAGNQPITLMTKNAGTALTGGASPNVTIAMTKTGSVGALQDSTVQLLKAGAAVGTNKFSATTWGTTDSTVTYGTSSDLWGTTWTAADVNAANFGLRFIAKNVAVSYADTASLDNVSITVTYKPDTNGIGTSSVPVKTANIGGTCTYLLQAAHTPCTATDHVYATTITSTPVASNPALVMPAVDYNYWWANAAPGPKHFCTNASPGLATDFFDNDAGSTSAPNGSIGINGEMAPNNADYTCQVVTNGVLQGELSWNHTTHVMNIFGTIFVDGNFRFDEDGEVIHYFGRANIMSSRDDEIDALVCAGGTGTTWATSCLQDMSNWDPSQNMMVLMSEMPNEYDQGGSTCAGNTPPTCYNGHLPSGFQGILYSTADCLIHQNFQDSGPVICQSVTLPNESGINPTYYTFPSIGNLTDGQKYGDATTATNFELIPGTMTGG